MKALFLTYRDTHSRRWTPVGKLTRMDGRYHFSYTKGANTIQNFVPFGRMSDLRTEYVSESLFPLFSNRVLPKSRPEYPDYLGWLGLTSANYDAFEELARTGGLRATDSLELIPCPDPTEGNTYNVYFFIRGLRHFTSDSQDRALKLVKGEQLFLCQDLQNKFDETALFLRTGDPVTLVGYAPRYYSSDFSSLISKVGANDVDVTVEKVNATAPLQYRVLCKLSAPWPKNFLPCQSGEFETISPTNLKRLSVGSGLPEVEH